MENLYAKNHHLEFGENYKFKYPSKIDLKKESISTSNAQFETFQL